MISAPFRHARVAIAIAAAGVASGCATGRVSDHGYSGPLPTKLVACYGYGCREQKQFPITPAVASQFEAIMKGADGSAEAERAAISRAVQFYEELSATAIGARDRAKSPVVASGKPGQMDCIDESTNTRHLLLYLEARGLLRHHTVQPNVSRGALLDGRYPHWTAVVQENAGGKTWAVDSWYEPAGGPPDIMALAEWRKRGVWGER